MGNNLSHQFMRRTLPSYTKQQQSFPKLLHYFPESPATEISSTSKVTLKLPTFFSGSLDLLPVISVHFITCISKDSIWLHITGKLPQSNNLNKRFLVLCQVKELILELDIPGLIWKFYEVLREPRLLPDLWSTIPRM